MQSVYTRATTNPQCWTTNLPSRASVPKQKFLTDRNERVTHTHTHTHPHPHTHTHMSVCACDVTENEKLPVAGRTEIHTFESCDGVRFPHHISSTPDNKFCYSGLQEPPQSEAVHLNICSEQVLSTSQPTCVSFSCECRFKHFECSPPSGTVRINSQLSLRLCASNDRPSTAPFETSSPHWDKINSNPNLAIWNKLRFSTRFTGNVQVSIGAR